MDRAAAQPSTWGARECCAGEGVCICAAWCMQVLLMMAQQIWCWAPDTSFAEDSG
jgi:hypothetical protein